MRCAPEPPPTPMPRWPSPVSSGMPRTGCGSAKQHFAVACRRWGYPESKDPDRGAGTRRGRTGGPVGPVQRPGAATGSPCGTTPRDGQSSIPVETGSSASGVINPSMLRALRSAW